MLRLNLGCSDQQLDGFLNVDRWEPPWATADNFQRVDLDGEWPWEDSSVEHIRAVDIIEHLSDLTHTMNKIHRVLKPGGAVEIIVPTTDGRGAFQDPTHKVFLNRNSFFYYEHGNPHLERFREAYGITARFKVAFEREETLIDNVTKLRIVLESVKGETSRPDASESGLAIASATDGHASKFAFSICHTTARVQQWRDVYEAWISAAVNPSATEYVLCYDPRWGFTGTAFAEVMAWEQSREGNKLVRNTGRRCYVDGVNLAAAASTGDVLIVNADDQYPCDKWDHELHEAIVADTMDGCADYVLEVSTGTPTEHERGIMVMPILSRERYDRFGWVFYPAYESMFADNDFCQMAKRDKCIIDARHLVFPHKHWVNQQREKDEQDRAQNRQEAYDEGAKLFAARKRVNFAGIPPKAEGKSDSDRPMIAFLTPGNVFSMAWVDAWSRLWGYVIPRYNVTHVMAYTSNAGMVRQMMSKAVQSTDYGVPVDYVCWIDDDNTITPEQFEMLLTDLKEHPEFDAVCGWTWCGGDDQAEIGTATVSCGALRGLEKTEDGKDVKFCYVKQLTPKEIVQSPTDLIEIGYSGFPVVLMRFDLLRKAGHNPFTPYVDDRCEWGFSGEDSAFFARAAVRSGARFAMDRRVHVPHFKRRAIKPELTAEQQAQAAKEMAVK